ncbi:TonB-dependent receptor [Sulfurovum sp. NBC37-1]|uniref:TonB-dependent receptor n=1 Tax=Sulfurovum sp. (strain NBC37-1) TaxID=387093 RepID=UPI0001587C61|nr:TonB-dependent receptor [Sulfurovum sp. NBC37-1]BAF73120.1 TonB-dependent copper receptor [Sulfurovum sp. NBC37-1]
MKKGIYLSLVCAMSLYAAEVELGTIDVEAKVDTEVVKDVHGEDIRSADVAEALMKQSSSVTLVRRSGIANDIIVRGQKKDNINVTIDGAKIYGACPNRMDPPISHVLANNIDYIAIDDGPFDVESFGALSANVDVETLKPTKELHGDAALNFGSWDYKKASAMISGGTDRIRFLLSASGERGGQYEDGDGNNFAQQMDNYIADNLNGNPVHDKKLKGQALLPQYRDMDAFTKKTVLAKMYWDITDNQQLKLSYTGNRSDDVLYPTTPMDALYDDSNIYNAEYVLNELGRYSKELDIQLYKSDVDHPMSNKYRKASNMMLMKNWLTTDTQGAKIKNRFDLDNHEVTLGIDYSLRNWNGAYYGKNDMYKGVSIPDVDTENIAFFAKDKIHFDKFEVDLGLRYDDTSVEPGLGTLQSNDYNALNGNILLTYHMDEKTKLFGGVGRSSRVPDGRELYFQKKGKVLGTPDLDLVTNTEFDIGGETQFEDATLKAKFFYSELGDFIFYNADKMIHRFENMDATLYGFEVSGSYIVTDNLYVDGALSFQKGEKDNPLSGQTGTNMPEIPPMKLIAGINLEEPGDYLLRAEVVAASAWDDYDADNGEQYLPGYAVLNLKGSKTFADHFEVTVGVDNLFDKTYAVSNTYEDLTLISGGGEVMLMNEPGRYIYTNLSYKF